MDGVEVTFTERSQKKKKNEDIGAHVWNFNQTDNNKPKCLSIGCETAPTVEVWRMRKKKRMKRMKKKYKIKCSTLYYSLL